MEEIGWTTIQADHCRAARAALNWTQAELSLRSKVSTRTIMKFEAWGWPVQQNKIRNLQGAFESAGIKFRDVSGDIEITWRKSNSRSTSRSKPTEPR